MDMDETLTTETIARQVAYANELAAQVDGALDRAWQTAVVLGYQLTVIKASLPHGEFGKLFAKTNSYNCKNFRFGQEAANKYMRLYRLCCDKAGQLGQGEALAALLEGLAPAPAALPAPGGNGGGNGGGNRLATRATRACKRLA